MLLVLSLSHITVLSSGTESRGINFFSTLESFLSLRLSRLLMDLECKHSAFQTKHTRTSLRTGGRAAEMFECLTRGVGARAHETHFLTRCRNSTRPSTFRAHPTSPDSWLFRGRQVVRTQLLSSPCGVKKWMMSMLCPSSPIIPIPGHQWCSRPRCSRLDCYVAKCYRHDPLDLHISYDTTQDPPC